MIHFVNLLSWSLDSTFNPRIPSGTAGEVFENRPTFILVTLKTFVQASIRIVVWLSCHPVPHADPIALFPENRGRV